jgi:predicted cobalt transporter CbtA
MSYWTFLKRALGAGAIAGCCSGLYVWAVGERSIEQALTLEPHSSGHAELFSRGTQVVGGVIAGIIFGTALSIVFATVFTSLRHRLVGRDDLRRSMVLAASGFVAVALLPAIKYPANPPGIGNPDTIGHRTATYLVFIVAGVLAAAVVWVVNERLSPRVTPPTRIVLVTILAVAVAIVMLLAAPSASDPIPATIPAALLWRFRLHSIGALAVLWGVLGLSFGWLCTRLPARSTAEG